MAGEQQRIFVSYSQVDRELVRRLTEELRRRDVLAYTRDEIPAGENGQNWLEGAIKRADAIVVIIESGSEPDESQLREWQSALEASWDNPEKRLIPLLVDGAKAPAFLADRVALKVNAGISGVDFNKLVRALIDPRKVWRSPSIDKERSRQRNERLNYIGKAAESLRNR
jgi:TIR domain